MAQKVNSTSLRLSKRLNWKNVLCTHHFNDYSNLIFNCSKILKTNNNIFHKLNVSENNIRIKKNSKVYSINSEALDSRYFFYYTKLILASKRIIQNFYQYKANYLILLKSIFKIFFINQRQLIHKMVNTDYKKKIKIFNNVKLNFLIMSPKVITEFVKIQMTTVNHTNLKKNTFASNLQKNILMFVNYFLAEFKYDILGLKIICSGKWKKTKTGRKQKLYLKFGQIQNSNIANKIIYHNLNQTTKYGVCSIKIWIAHKTK